MSLSSRFFRSRLAEEAAHGSALAGWVDAVEDGAAFAGAQGPSGPEDALGVAVAEGFVGVADSVVALDDGEGAFLLFRPRGDVRGEDGGGHRATAVGRGVHGR